MRAHKSDNPGGDAKELEAHRVIFTAEGVLNLFVFWQRIALCFIYLFQHCFSNDFKLYFCVVFLLLLILIFFEQIIEHHHF